MKFALKSLVALIVITSSVASQGKFALGAETGATPHENVAITQSVAYSQHHYYVRYSCDGYHWHLKGCYECLAIANEVADGLRARYDYVEVTCDY